ncbi:MAG: metal ABC transporter permease [Gemmataceae bacterium]
MVETIAIGALTACACAVLGVFLVLRRMSLLSDAIAHSMLFGIVVTFFFVRDLSSPVLIVGAAATGLLTVSLVELLQRTRLLREDAAIGLVFPALFSAGVAIISLFFRDVDLDTNCVLMGNIEFAKFRRWIVFAQPGVLGSGYDLGPKALWVMGTILILNLAFIITFYKELKLGTFDAGLAATFGFVPGLLHYGLMTLVSVTAVGAFQSVGAILVIALMIAPPAAAYLLTDRLSRMLWLSAALGVAGAALGYALSLWWSASIAGSMATAQGILFVFVWLVAPERGLVAALFRRARQRWDFAQTMLAIHVFNHEGTPEAEQENRVENLPEHLRWQPNYIDQVVRRAERRGLIRCEDGLLKLNQPGRQLVRDVLVTS